MIKKFRSIIAKRLPVIGKAFMLSALIFVIFAFLILSIPHQALAQASILGDPVVWLQNQIAHLILLIAKWIGDLTLTLIGLLVDVAKFNNFIYAPAVEKGWVIVRDVCNMFFIVILLLIAFGSVFRIEEYQYKKILGKLLIMAVLINFSKTICGFFIDIAQVVMLTFVNGFKEAAAGNFVVGFHLTDIFQFSAQAEGAPPVEGTAYLAAAAMALITIVITAIVVGIYLIILLLRIIAIWFLVIISPVAYVLSAFPGDAKKYSSQWWDYFGKYVTTGPILAFFLWLSLAVMQMDTSAKSYGFVTSDTQGTIPAATITKIGSSEVLLSFIINIMLLIGGLWMAQQLGVAGGKLASAVSSKIQNVGATIGRAPMKAIGGAGALAWKGTKGTGKFLWQSVSSRAGIEGSLKKWKEGWQKGVTKRASDRVTRQQSKYLERVSKGSMLQFLGSPAHFFTHHWNTKTLGKVASFNLGDITGKTAAKERAKAKAADEKIKELEIKKKGGKGYVGDVKANIKLSKESITSLEKKKDEKIEQMRNTENLEELDKLQSEVNAIDKEINEKKKEHNEKYGKYDGKSDSEIEAMERQSLMKESQDRKDEANKLREVLKSGLLSPDQQDNRNKKIEELEAKQVGLLEQLKAKKEVMVAQGRSKSEILQAQASGNIELNNLRERIAGLREPGITAEEKTEQQVKIEQLDNESVSLKKQAEQGLLTDVEIGNVDDQLESLKEEKVTAERRAREFAPATDYEIRREQRTEVNKEMNEMQTDNWQELYKIMKDAIDVGDTNRAAAAYLKATKYGNENEIQNELGFDSDANGMKQVIESVFIKKLGMAREQAMSIASDASYIAEGAKHWGVARAVVVKNGQMEWNDEPDRQKEVMAEVRKVDFERFMREANRLAWGTEVPGANYDVTQQRDFHLNDFGKTYFLEHWKGMKELLGKERFNVNLAVKLTSGDNLKELEKLARTGLVKEEEMDLFMKFTEALKGFAGTEGGEFANLEKVQGTNK